MLRHSAASNPALQPTIWMTSRRIFIRQLTALRRGRREHLRREMHPGRQIALEAGDSHATAEVGASCERKRAETLTPEAPMPMDKVE